MTINHKKRDEISIKTSKFMTLHVEPPVLVGNRIFSGTVLNVIEFAVDLDSVKVVFLIGYFFTLLVHGFGDTRICFFVGLGNRIAEKLLVIFLVIL